MDQLFAKYPTLLQLQDAGGSVVLWFLTGGDINDGTTWLSETKALTDVDPQMQADVLTALGDRSFPQVAVRPTQAGS